MEQYGSEKALRMRCVPDCEEENEEKLLQVTVVQLALQMNIWKGVEHVKFPFPHFMEVT